jgi:hypothetical protein
MSDYSQVTSFGPKDALITGDPNKVIRGTEFDSEFSAISTAIATKYDSADIASNAQADAGSSDTVLMTPAKVKRALENLSVTLGSNVLLSGGIAATDVARKGQANTFTAQQTFNGTGSIRIGGTSDTATTNIAYVSFRNLSGTEIGWVGESGSGSADITLTNNQSGADVNLVTTGGGIVKVNGTAIPALSHSHSAADITSGTLAEARGGTGNGNGVARNVSAKTGTAKTLSSSAPSGGADGDIWYRHA